MKYKQLNQYLSNLAIFNVKLHNLHWNVRGLEFMAIHTFTESLYNAFFLQYDDVAELIKIQGQSPLNTLKEYLVHGTITELEQDVFTPEEVIDHVLGDLKLLKEDATAIRKTAVEEDDFETVAMFETIIPELDKNIWFLNSMRG